MTEEFLAHLAKHPAPDVKDVILGNNSASKVDNLLWEWAKQQENGADNSLVGSILSGESYDSIKRNAKEQGSKDVLEILDLLTPPTKFHQYQLPGGENYREVLLKLPDDRRNMTFQEWYDATHIQPLESYADNPRMMQIFRDKYEHDIKNMPKQGGFRSQHWDDPNVLAHIRMSDRTGPNGEKILHVEEVQSDWGQKGKKEGFNSDLEKWNRYEKLADIVQNDPTDKELAEYKKLKDEFKGKTQSDFYNYCHLAN